MKHFAAVILVLLLSICAKASAEDRPRITQPPQPTWPEATPRVIGDPLPAEEYGYPAAVKGYTFVSLRGMDFDWFSLPDTLMIQAVYRFFEEVYPGCRLEQLREFTLLKDAQFSIKADWIAALPEEYRDDMLFINCHALRFAHPLVESAQFDILLDYYGQSVFFTDAPFMAEDLAAFARSPVTREDALRIAMTEYTARLSESSLPVPGEEELAALRLQTKYVVYPGFSQDEYLRMWHIAFCEPQTPFDSAADPASEVFYIEINADTGEVVIQYLTSEPARKILLKLLDDEN